MQKVYRPNIAQLSIGLFLLFIATGCDEKLKTNQAKVENDQSVSGANQDTDIGVGSGPTVVSLPVAPIETSNESPNGSGAIIGGQNILESEYNTVGILLDYTNYPTSIGICSATLISPSIILTAAHCVPSGSNLNNFRFNRNANLSSFPPSNSSGMVGFTEVRINPLYSSSGQAQGDLALMKLNAPQTVQGSFPEFWDQTKNLVPSLLNPLSPTNFTIVGYGNNTTSSTGAGVKRKGTVALRGWTTLSSAVLGVFFSVPTYEFISVISVFDQMICGGDSGGPAFFNFGGKDYLIGVVSRGLIPNGNPNCSTSNSGLHTSTYQHINWIKTNLQQMDPMLIGDFNKDTFINASDIDEISLKIRQNTGSLTYDLNQDRTVNNADRIYLIEQILNTRMGDINLNRVVDSADYVLIRKGFSLPSAGWATGDMNGDGIANNDDYNLWRQNFGYSQP